MASKNCIADNSCLKFTSTHVEGEIKRRTERAIREIQREFLGFIRNYSNRRIGCAVTDSDYELFTNKVTELGLKIAPLLLPQLVEMRKMRATYGQLFQFLRELQRDFRCRTQEGIDYIVALFTTMEIESWRRIDDYPEIDAQLSQIIRNENDRKIILDAHDLTITVPKPLNFITGDHKDIILNESIIISLTGVSKVTYLADFAS